MRMNRTLGFLDRYLDPGEQLGTVLFGLIMALTITLGASWLVSRGGDPARDVLLSVLGGNTAWGIIQGWLYVIDCVFERSRHARLIRLAQEAPDEARALAVLRAGLEPQLDDIT